MQFGIGQPVRRVEDRRLVTGAGRYVDDISHPGQTHAVFLRSDVAHGVLNSVDASAARAAPGVLGVYTFAEIADRLTPLGNAFPLETLDGNGPPPVTMPHLANEKVRFVGQPIAMVVAETRDQARDAAELIGIDIDDLPAVTSRQDAMAEGAAQLHTEAPGNIAYTWEVGDKAATDAAFATADHVATVTIVNQRIVVSAMEPRGTNVRYDVDTGQWSVQSGTQGSHSLKNKLVAQMGVAPERVRVETFDVGGGFGMKLQAHPEDALLCLAAKDLGRPVKWTADRSESFLSDSQGRDVTTEGEGAFAADGRLLAMRCRSVSNLGAYFSSVGAGVHTAFSAPLLGGFYNCPAMYHHVTGIFTNSTSTDAYRGAGRPEAIHATERIMEQAALDMGMDRAAIRRINLVTPDMVPHATVGGFDFDSSDARTCLDQALAAAGYDAFAERRRAAEAAGDLAGLGVAYYFERSGGGPNEAATLSVLPEGAVEGAVGTQSTGQGHETTWLQVIHDALGVDFGDLTLLNGDTDRVPLGGGTGGSRSAIMASRVFLLAAEDVIQKGLEGAERLLEAGPADIEYETDGALYRVAGTDRTVTLYDVAREMGGITGAGSVGDRTSSYPNGAHICEARIDRQTGAARLIGYWIVDDFGNVINPLIVEGQVHGGIVQGLGQVMGETAVWDEDGQPLAASYMDYQMPRADDTPPFSFALNTNAPCTTNPLGLKGCGEAGSAGGLCAGTLAVLDALRSAGVETLHSPYTPNRIWAALQEAEQARGVA